MKQKLNWRKIIYEIPEISDIFKTGEIAWINATDIYEEGEIVRTESSFAENYMQSDLEYDLDHIVDAKDEKAIKILKI